MILLKKYSEIFKFFKESSEEFKDIAKKLKIDSKEWAETYEQLISIIGKVGILTEQSTEKIIQKLDEIDNL